MEPVGSVVNKVYSPESEDAILNSEDENDGVVIEKDDSSKKWSIGKTTVSMDFVTFIATTVFIFTFTIMSAIAFVVTEKNEWCTLLMFLVGTALPAPNVYLGNNLKNIKHLVTTGEK